MDVFPDTQLLHGGLSTRLPCKSMEQMHCPGVTVHFFVSWGLFHDRFRLFKFADSFICFFLLPLSLLGVRLSPLFSSFPSAPPSSVFPPASSFIYLLFSLNAAELLPPLTQIFRCRPGTATAAAAMTQHMDTREKNPEIEGPKN